MQYEIAIRRFILTLYGLVGVGNKMYDIKKTGRTVCWINEKEKIISFHHVYGYKRREFTDKDSLRRFIFLSVYEGYKLQ